LFNQKRIAMSNIHRRAWLRQSSLAIAGLTLAGKLSASAHENPDYFPAGPIRLTSNENPYGPSPMARKAMADAINGSNRYPWETTNVLRQEIASKYSLGVDNVLMGAGSSEILGLVAIYASFNKGNAVTGAPSFQSWIPVAEKMGLEIVRVPLTREKKLDLPAMLSKINNQTRLLYLCNPNNPTGTTLSSSSLKSFIEEVSAKTLVLLDEAYIEYCDEPTLASMVANNKNLVIAKTFSKIYGLAGARIGYALAHPSTITQLSSVQPWPNATASLVSAAAGIASLRDKDFISSTRKNNSAARDFTIKELNAFGFECIPSHTNFLYYSINKFNGNWPDQLRSRNILTNGFVEQAGKWTRTTIGTMDEMQSFISAVKQIV